MPFQQVFGGTIFEKKLILIQVFCRECKASGRQCCAAVKLLEVVHKVEKFAFFFRDEMHLKLYTDIGGT